KDEAMTMRSIKSFLLIGIALLASAAGCKTPEVSYGVEERLALSGKHGEVWAVAPAINLSGERDVDPILQADLVFHQAQAVRGLTTIPVQRVVEIYESLRIDKLQSAQQASLVCDLLGYDGLLVPTVTIDDPYNPPKF